MSVDVPRSQDKHGARFWIALTAGWTVIGVGVAGLMGDAADTHPTNFLLYFTGGALIHDLVLAPIVVGFGWLVIRRLPSGIRPVVAGALIVTGAVGLYAFPFVRGYGHDPTNTSLLPNNYAKALAAVVAVVAGVAGLVAVLARRRGRRLHRRERPPGARRT